MNNPTINIIAAMTQDRVIGLDGKIPWHIPEDLKYFRQLTLHNAVIMGKNTYESLGKYLDKRLNIIVSKSMKNNHNLKEQYDTILCESVNEAITVAKSLGKDIFLIGGERIYQEGLSLADKMYISLIKKNYTGNIYFPKFEKSEWNISKLKENLEFEVYLYERKVKI